MIHLCTEVVPTSLFTRHDFDQAMDMLRQINRDIDGDYPEYDDELREWVADWLPQLNLVSSNALYYIALPVDGALIFSPPDIRKCATMMEWPHSHPLLLVGVAVLINLSQCEQFSEISAILHYFRGNRWKRRPVDMPRSVAVTVRQTFYQTLEQLIDERRRGLDES